jgi:leucyl/phenylalanyl-tRNA--protein transferase
LAGIVRRAARILLPRVSGGVEVGEQLALDALGFTPETVINAYLNGYFPMAGKHGKIVWRSPEQRCLIPIDNYKVRKSLMRIVKQAPFEIRANTAFEEVVRGCADREETWISEEVVSVYTRLHAMGIAHSVEAWQDGKLAGGLYGIALGRYFATESQFFRVANAGQVAFVHTFQLLRERGFLLHDVQFKTPFLEQFGAIEIPRRDFRLQLTRAVVQPAEFALPNDRPVAEPAP